MSMEAGGGVEGLSVGTSVAYIKTVRKQSRINEQTSKMVWRVLLLKCLKGIWLALLVRRN